MQPPPPGPPPQWGPPPDGPPDHGQQPPPLGPPQQWGGYGPPTFQQTLGGITLAVIGLLGLLGAILTLTLWINLNSAENHAADVCNRFKGEYANSCRHQIESMVPSLPVALVVCLFIIIAACLAVAVGATMLFVKRALGQFVILGGGIVMLVLSIGVEARYGATSRVTYDLITGLVIAVIGGLMFVPAFRVLLGLPPQLSAQRAGLPPGPWPQGPTPPPPYGPPPQW